MPDSFASFAASLDYAQLLDRCLGRHELAERILCRFVEQFADDLSKLEQLLADKDRAGLRRQAHRMKGACSSVAATELVRCMTDLDAQAERLGNEDTLDDGLQRIRREWAHFKDAFESMQPTAKLPRNSNDPRSVDAGDPACECS